MVWDAALALLAGAGAAATAPLSGVAAFARRRYLVARHPDETLKVRTDDGWELRMLHYVPKAGTQLRKEPVILCHGLSANSYSLDLDDRHSMARYLVERGFHVLVPDLRGRPGSWPVNASRSARHAYTFGHHASEDAPALLRAALERTNARRAFWVGHSMGGMVGYVLASREYEKVAGLVTMASPVNFQVETTLEKLLQFALRVPIDPIPHGLIARALACVATETFPPIPDIGALRSNIDPVTLRRALANAIVDLPHGLVRQFAEWAEYERLPLTDAGRDYLSSIEEVRTPLLCVAGNSDRLAPPANVRPACQMARSDDHRYVCLGEDGLTAGRSFGHGDMLLGREAPELVYDLVARWLAERATRVAAAPHARRREAVQIARQQASIRRPPLPAQRGLTGG